MNIGIPEVLLLFALLVYIYMLIDRVCKCAEQCSLNKSLSTVYGKLNTNCLSDIVKSDLLKANSKES